MPDDSCNNHGAPGVMAECSSEEPQFDIVLPAPPESTSLIISSPRLLLRALRDSDAEGLFAIRSREDTVRTLWPFIPDADVSATRQWMARKTFTAPPGAVGLRYQFVILLAHDPTGRIIGTVGINELVPVPTLGYLIHPDEWGKGYATEATSSMIKAWWSLPRRGKWGKQDKLYAICNEKNLGSFKVLLKCGFHVVGEQTMEDGAVLKNFELERPDWSL
ncbi:N-acetyltransferase [Histoplasma capsulatum]|uniref:N-acetyltransferase n=1 Tax=Ajellomyces capsulatus TaxID=5037 RepID=A0A8A1M9L3_AJECA|nr:N-acetyltransferase [Histoplasma capsulatum]